MAIGDDGSAVEGPSLSGFTGVRVPDPSAFESLSDWLPATIDALGVSIPEFARAAGLRREAVVRILDEREAPIRRMTVKKIANAVGIPFDALDPIWAGDTTKRKREAHRQRQLEKRVEPVPDALIEARLRGAREMLDDFVRLWSASGTTRYAAERVAKIYEEALRQGIPPEEITQTRLRNIGRKQGISLSHPVAKRFMAHVLRFRKGSAADSSER